MGTAAATREATAIESIDVAAYRIPTDAPESDGTFAWQATTLVVADVRAGGAGGLGYTYADTATATLIRDVLAPVVADADAMAVPAAWCAMVRAVRNLGRPGVCAMAISALDAALWDLKAKLLGLPLVTLLGAVRGGAALYASGGFTSYAPDRLREQLGSWAAQGFARVKMKVGTDPAADPVRVRAAREAIGDDVELFVDANGAYDRKRALHLAEAFADLGVTWFEEPVVATDLAGLRLLRDRAPARVEIAAGEYGWEPADFARLLEAGAVDVLQADASRCGGITGFVKAAALCEASAMPLSAHCAPALHVHPCCALAPVRHIEYFHDHARIEHMLFDGVPEPADGVLSPDLSRPGLGLELKRADAERFRVL